MKSLYVAASLALLTVPASGAAQTSERNAVETADKKQAKETRYCFTYETIVGSRLTRRECKTKAEWARQGVDVERELNKR